MNITFDQICANVARLRALGCDPHSDASDLHHEEVADDALEGRVACSDMGGWSVVHAGRRDIDWSAHEGLGRFAVVGSLARRYAASADERYAGAARDYIEDWMRAHPVQAEWKLARYDHVLILARRLNVWVGRLPDFRGSRAFDEAFVQRVVASCVCQLDYLMGHLQSFGNIRYTGAEALLYGGLRLRQSPRSDAWIRQGVWTINDAFHRQILPDGAHVELNPRYNQTPGYWRVCQLQQAMPELGLALDPARFVPAFDYYLANLKPNGAHSSLHDSHGRHTGPRPKGWDGAYMRFRREAGLPLGYPPTSQNFPCAGQAFWRDSWNEDAVYVTFDACRYGGPHTHLSRNSVQVHAYGRTLLADVGSLAYGYGQDFTYHGKSTRAHNTINFNGWNQSYSPAEARFASTQGYDLAAGYYTGGYWPGRCDWGFKEGYGPGIWGSHHRTLLWVRGRFLLALDRVCHGDAGSKRFPVDKMPSLESNWQFSQGRVILDPERLTARTDHEDGNVMMLFPLCSAEGGTVRVKTALDVHAGEKDPLRGWGLDDHGELVAAPQVSFSIPKATPWTDLATVIVPFRGGNCPEVSAASHVGASGGRLDLNWGDGTCDTVYWTHQLQSALDDFGSGRTDASLLHLMSDSQGRCIKGMMVDGTMAEPYTGRLGSSPGMHAFASPQQREK